MLSTWAVILAPAAVVALVVGELLVPVLLSAQSEETIWLGRLFMLTVVLGLAFEPFMGITLGDQDFGFANALRVTPPLILAVSYAVLWVAGALTVSTAVVANIVVAVIMLALAATRVLRRHSFGRPEKTLGRRSLWYGARAHGDIVASSANTRLDLMIMPAFLSSVTVGLYSVAANVAGIVLAVCGSLSTVVMSAAARRGPEGPTLIAAVLQVTLIVGAGIAILIGLVSGPAVRLIYGADFAGSITPLRLLLPGVVLMAGASVAAAGLYAVNRPFTAFSAQLAGMAVTVPGLVIFLPRGGATAAAIVSSVAYSTVFVVMVSLYTHVSDFRWRNLLTFAPWMTNALKALMSRAA